jgi:hypothetical protein
MPGFQSESIPTIKWVQIGSLAASAGTATEMGATWPFTVMGVVTSFRKCVLLAGEDEDEAKLIDGALDVVGAGAAEGTGALLATSEAAVHRLLALGITDR